MEFKFGPIQEKWLKSLEEHPERQAKQSLGYREKDGTYKACCLGELGLIAGICDFNEEGYLYAKCETQHTGLLHDVYEQVGLINSSGSSRDKLESLSNLNDYYKTWPEIAAIVKANPELYFNKSV